jgi:hypothetical protein
MKKFLTVLVAAGSIAAASVAAPAIADARWGGGGGWHGGGWHGGGWHGGGGGWGGVGLGFAAGAVAHLRPLIMAMGMAMPRPLTVIRMATITAMAQIMAITPQPMPTLRPTATLRLMATVSRGLIVMAIGVPGTSIIRIIGRTTTCGTTRSGATRGVTEATCGFRSGPNTSTTSLPISIAAA